MSEKSINRIKVLLVERKLTIIWLAELLGKNEATVSRWCTSDVQPTMNTFVKIAEKLNVKLTSLFNE
ncbi:MAG: helix-turn-helix transcriptional regulator [Chitinophagaceae bacterium]|nr:helix-turn-helix transcriptional regulator [Chitinophagaceae bacterium]